MGSNNLENTSILSDIYMNWHYACKSLLIFHEFLSDNKKQQNIVSEDVPSCELQFQRLISIDKEQDVLKTAPSLQLSKLISKEYNEVISQNIEQPSSGNWNIDQVYQQLYNKLVPLMTHYQFQKPDRTNHYEHYIKMAPNKQMLSLQMKMQFLRVISIQEAKKKSENLWEDSINLEINRDSPWQSTLDCLKKLTAPQLVVKKLKIQFPGEEGIDYGGLTREWLALLNKTVFNPDCGLFETSANGRSIQPSPFSAIVSDHLLVFKYVGRLIGKSLIEGWNLDLNFTKSFLKHMLKKTLFISDLQDIDPELSKSLTWILENNMDTNDLQYDFTQTIEYLGKISNLELLENGTEIIVNESNKKEYVKALCTAKMTKNIEHQAMAFIKGLEEMVPQEGLQLLSEQELGLHMAGMPTVDVNDLYLNTSYSVYSKDDNIIIWFWEIMNEFDQVMRANFLYFISGSFKVPIGGFKHYPMKIEKTYASIDSLPVAHTCFNQIDIPEYQSKEIFFEKLCVAVMEGQQGFYIG